MPDPIHGTYTAAEIATEVEAFKAYYKDNVEVALIDAAVAKLTRQSNIDVLQAYEQEFDLVEVYCVKIPNAVADFKNQAITTVEKTELQSTVTASGRTGPSATVGNIEAEEYYVDSSTPPIAKGGVFATEYRPLILAYHNYCETFSRMNPGQPIKPLEVDFTNPWEELANIKHKQRSYTQAEKEAIEDRVRKGLQESPQSVRNEFVNEHGSLHKTFAKLDAQASTHTSRMNTINTHKTAYLEIMFAHSALQVCEDWIEKLSQVRTTY
jgi:hypothetical protein